MRAPAIIVILLLGSAGCSSETAVPDSNVEVFQTVDQVAAERRTRQAQIWQETAAAFITTERPDVKAAPAEQGFAVVVEADGVSHSIDLSPIAESLAAQSSRSTEILREHIRAHLPAFDQQRMAALPLSAVQARIRPILVNGAILDRMSVELAGGAPLPAQNLVVDLYWLPAVRWRDDGVATAIGPDALKAWRISLDELQRIALDNLRGELRGQLFETSTIPSAGRTGHLRPGVEAAVVMLPEFLGIVRREWGTRDNLALLLASEDQVRFTEASNKRLLDMMWPQWRHALQRGLSNRLVMLADSGITTLDYTPPLYIPGGTTRPTSGPAGPTSRPSGAGAARPYIVR